MEASGYPFNSFRLCLDMLSDNIIEGCFYHLLTEKGIAFRDISEFLLYADRILDMSGFPQSFQEKRSFQTEPSGNKKHIKHILMDGEKLKSMKGKAATVDVVVMSRRHTSWQGAVNRTDGSRIGVFTGELELIGLLEKLESINGV